MRRWITRGPVAALTMLGIVVTTLGIGMAQTQTATIKSVAASDNQTQKILHLLNRITYGPRPGDIEAVKKIGIEHYIQMQLNPASVHEDPNLATYLGREDTLQMSPMALFDQYGPILDPRLTQAQKQLQNKDRREAARQVIQEAIENRVLRSLYSERQLQEVMTEFWFNHFNVSMRKGFDYVWIGSYERDAIRPYALGRFRDLLEATSHNPAMMFYLDNWLNTAPTSPGARGRFTGINENYARELMELHTLGVNGGYTQQDVISLAHILTGWGIPLRPRERGNITENGFYFDESRHDETPNKVLMGQVIRGRGEGEGEAALDMLARNPATAKHISYQLAQYFVSDNPPAPLVSKMSQTFLSTDGNIRAVLDTMLHSSEFWDSATYNAKFKPPYRFVISALRATAQPVDNVQPLESTLTQMGMPLYLHETPDGYKYIQSAWLDPDAIIRRISFATAIGVGVLPLDRNLQKQPQADANALYETLGGVFSQNTTNAIEKAPQRLQAAMVLGSPEFMKY